MVYDVYWVTEVGWELRYFSDKSLKFRICKTGSSHSEGRREVASMQSERPCLILVRLHVLRHRHAMLLFHASLSPFHVRTPSSSQIRIWKVIQFCVTTLLPKVFLFYPLLTSTFFPWLKQSKGIYLITTLRDKDEAASRSDSQLNLTKGQAAGAGSLESSSCCSQRNCRKTHAWEQNLLRTHSRISSF